LTCYLAEMTLINYPAFFNAWRVKNIYFNIPPPFPVNSILLNAPFF
jgi:hypothetical protein